MPPKQTLGPCTLDGRFVRLEPLRPEHLEGLAEIARLLDWSIMLYPLLSKDDVERRILSGMEKERLGEEYAFAVRLKDGNRLVGSTAYLSVVARHRRVEIGSTWYSPEFQGTYVNPECKFLLLRHAFEDWGAVRVQLGTDVRNVRSQRAILKLGATFEGKLRNHGVMSDGKPRDAFLYSIISEEWPTVRSRLISRLGSY